MALDFSGHYYMDGIDLWNYGVVVEKGSDDFLKYAPAKEVISHDWTDRNGTEVDTSNPLLQSRQIALQCQLYANSASDFQQKYDALIKHLLKPNLRRLQITELGSKTYYCRYKETTSFTRYTRLQGSSKIWVRFILVLQEPEPQLNSSLTFLVDEQGRYIVT